MPAVALPGSTAATVSYLIGLTVLVLGLVTGARSLTPRQRRPWLPWIAGMGCALGGSAIWHVSVLLDRAGTVGDLATVLWIAFYFPITLAVVRMIEERALDRDERSAIAKDVAVVTAAAAIFAWHLLIQPALAGAESTGQWAALLAAFSFPLGDVAILALGLTMLLAPGRRSVSERLIVLGLSASLVVDILHALLPMAAPGADDSWYMPSYLVINATLTAAVLHPSRAVVTEPVERASGGRGLRGWRMVLLGTALCGVGLSAMVSRDDGWDVVPAGIAMVVMIAFILSRLHRAVADLEKAHGTLRHQATHDQLTGVANRNSMMMDLRAALTQAPTLFFVDLDGFKAVNDTWGHHVGDAVLKAVADRLSHIVRRSDTVARLGGDEFVVVCTGIAEPAALAALANRMEQSLSEPVATDDCVVTIGASIGILTVPHTAPVDVEAAEELVDDLLRTADAAMYEAKRDGGGTRIVEYVLTA
jgi:diguanylate cyclase (GGDEF)-like protein